MSLYMCARSARANSNFQVSQFTLIDDTLTPSWHASIGEDLFVLTRDSAAHHGMPGHDLWTLRLRHGGHFSGRTWSYSEIKVTEIPLHARTSALSAGGWQCWSESPFLSARDVLRAEAFPERNVFGDGEVFCYPEKRGVCHAWSFSVSQVEGGSNNGLFAALDEDLFFTRFEFDLESSRYCVAFDTEGASYENMRTPRDRRSNEISLGAWTAPTSVCGDFRPLHELSAAWMRLVRFYERTPRSLDETEQRPRRAPVRGYTSWYLHYDAITEDILSAHRHSSARPPGAHLSTRRRVSSAHWRLADAVKRIPKRHCSYCRGRQSQWPRARHLVRSLHSA
jgi:hypothetical protein